MPLRLLVALFAAWFGAQEITTRKPGSDVPPFELQALDGKKVTSAELLGDAKEKNVLVIVFWAVQCPWVEKVNPELEALFQEFAKQRNVRFAMVDSDHNETGDVAAIKACLAKGKYTFPVYLDVGNKVADAFGARTTPHCFVVGKDRKIVYTGRVNDARPLDAQAVAPAKGAPPPPPVNPLLKKAILAAIDGKAPDVAVDAPTGCRIKRQ
jgi:thiol-disulfide isomerase/thioredoxin